MNVPSLTPHVRETHEMGTMLPDTFDETSRSAGVICRDVRRNLSEIPLRCIRID